MLIGSSDLNIIFVIVGAYEGESISIRDSYSQALAKIIIGEKTS